MVELTPEMGERINIVHCNRHQRSDEDSCAQCDEENPVWGENPVWQRTLSIYVDVPVDWLLPNGEEWTEDNAIAADAWQELRDEVRVALANMYNKVNGYRKEAWPKFDVDWEDVAERKET
tara:strand:+ start:727 stop:1086 length:360 start_codon:yes stop_codon:yes gene_type:complete